MSEDERIKLPWEDADDDEPVTSPAIESGVVQAAPIAGPDTDEFAEADQSRASGFASGPVESIGAQPSVSAPSVPDLPHGDPEPANSGAGSEAPDTDEGESASIHWSSGAVARSEWRRIGGGNTASGLSAAWLKLRSRLRGEDRVDEDDEVWLTEPEQAREIGGWLDELQVPSGSGENTEIYLVGSSIATDLAGEDDGELDASVEVLAGPRAEVAVPRFSRGRFGVVGGALLVLALIVGVYAVLIPTLRGRNYQSELRLAFAGTSELREALPAVLAGGEIPDDIAGEGVRYRELASSYSLYAKAVAAPPPAKPLVSFSSSMSEALGARESLLSLNDSLAPAVEEVRARGNYLDTLAAVADQMRIAQSVLRPDGQADAETILIIEATVANATSLYAVLSTQRPPTGYEALHARLLNQLGEYVKTGREYSLALKKTDEGAAAALRERLYGSARSFEDVTAEPVGQGVDDMTLTVIARKSEEATRRLE